MKCLYMFNTILIFAKRKKLLIPTSLMMASIHRYCFHKHGYSALKEKKIIDIVQIRISSVI